MIVVWSAVGDTLLQAMVPLPPVPVEPPFPVVPAVPVEPALPVVPPVWSKRWIG